MYELIQDYYKSKGLTEPDIDEAMAFLWTEVAEVQELLLQRQEKWVRSNPEAKPAYSRQAMAEELADVVMMSLKVALLANVDPLGTLTSRLRGRQ